MTKKGKRRDAGAAADVGKAAVRGSLRKVAGLDGSRGELSSAEDMFNANDRFKRDEVNRNTKSEIENQP